MKKVNKDPFSNGESYDRFDWANCDGCIKNSVYDTKHDRYTNSDEHGMPIKCSILRDIMTRMFCNEHINERTIKVCEDFTLRGIKCPYRKTEWPRKKPKKQPKEQMKLEL